MYQRHIIDPTTRLADFRGRCALAVMAKAPKPGSVKTRLSPPLNPEQAAALNIAFLRDTIACLQEVATIVDGVPVISYTPIGAEREFDGIIADNVMLLPQRGAGFGERLHGTVEDLLSAGFCAVCLIDSDSPTVPREAYVEAVDRLLSGEDCAVLGPSQDGGYYLLGVNAPHPRLFTDIIWSSAAVFEQTLERAQSIDLPVHSLPTWFDVDDGQTLGRLFRELVGPHRPRGAFAAEHTKRYLQTIADGPETVPGRPYAQRGAG